MILTLHVVTVKIEFLLVVTKLIAVSSNKNLTFFRMVLKTKAGDLVSVRGVGRSGKIKIVVGDCHRESVPEIEGSVLEQEQKSQKNLIGV